MICPNEMCKKEIADDSVFCDQCGCQLRECLDCHAILHTPFCSKCGTPTVERKWMEPATPTEKNHAESSVVDMANNTENTPRTLIIAKTPTLKLQHDDLILDIKSGDVLGRTTGAHAGVLADCKVISSRHAEICLNDNKFFITDLGSTNGTYLNNQKLEPNSEYEIHDGDIVTLADFSFTVQTN